MSSGPTPRPKPGARHRALVGHLLTHAPSLADQTASRYLEARPELRTHVGSVAQVRWREDGALHLDHLAAALATERPQLFDDYVVWLHQLARGDGRDHDDIAQHLSILVDTIGDTLGPDAAATVSALVAGGLAAAEPVPSAAASHLDPSSPLGTLATAYLDALLARDHRRALASIRDAADAGVAVEDLYLEVFAPVLREIGRRWQLGEATVGQEHLVTAATQLAMAQLYPRMFATPRNGRAVVVAAVGGELHEVGARMVADLFELDGWDSHFLGASTPTAAVVDLVEQVPAEVLALSVTLPSHVPIATELVTRCRQRCPGTTILAGGRPFTMVPDLWEQIGADGTAGDARHAVQRATELVGAP